MLVLMFDYITVVNLLKKISIYFIQSNPLPVNGALMPYLM